MIGGKAPNAARSVYPQFEISLLELNNDRVEKTLLSNKANRMKPNMPKNGFYRHCSARLGDYVYVFGGSRAEVYRLDWVKKELTKTNVRLPFPFSRHSCATFQDKVWICAPQARSRRDADRQCWALFGLLNLKTSFYGFF